MSTTPDLGSLFDMIFGAATPRPKPDIPDSQPDTVGIAQSLLQKVLCDIALHATLRGSTLQFVGETSFKVTPDEAALVARIQAE